MASSLDLQATGVCISFLAAELSQNTWLKASQIISGTLQTYIVCLLMLFFIIISRTSSNVQLYHGVSFVLAAILVTGQLLSSKHYMPCPRKGRGHLFHCVPFRQQWKLPPEASAFISPISLARTALCRVSKPISGQGNVPLDLDQWGFPEELGAWPVRTKGTWRWQCMWSVCGDGCPASMWAVCRRVALLCKVENNQASWGHFHRKGTESSLEVFYK